MRNVEWDMVIGGARIEGKQNKHQSSSASRHARRIVDLGSFLVPLPCDVYDDADCHGAPQ